MPAAPFGKHIVALEFVSGLTMLRLRFTAADSAHYQRGDDHSADDGVRIGSVARAVGKIGPAVHGDSTLGRSRLSPVFCTGRVRSRWRRVGWCLPCIGCIVSGTFPKNLINVTMYFP